MNTGLVSALFALMVLMASPAVAQKSVLADGIRQFHHAMLADDAARALAAIDAMAAGLAASGTGAPPPRGRDLLDDEAADVPILPLAAFATGFDQLVRGEYREAIVSLRTALAVSTDERAQLVEAGRLAQQGRDRDAEQILRSVVMASPRSAVARWWLARIYERLNQAADARREYEAVVAVALTGRAPLYAAIGRLSRTEGDLVRATDAFEQRLRLIPRDPGAHKDLARIHLEQGRTEQALAMLDAAVAIDPLDAQAHAEIGRIRLDTGRPAEAIVALRRALDLAPTLYEPRYPLAQALRQMGRGDEAARELDLFERGRRAATEDRRRTMAAEVQREEAPSQGQAR